MALTSSLGLSVAASAQRKPQEYKPRELSAEEIDDSKLRSRDALPGFGRNEEEPPVHFPWMALGLAIVVLAGAAPFALRYYSSVSKDLRPSDEDGRNRRGGRSD